MIIVAGRLYVLDRTAYLRRSSDPIAKAGAAPGCLDFYLSPDPLEADRTTVYERWESAADVEAFRGSGPDEDQAQAVRKAAVLPHEVATTTAL